MVANRSIPEAEQRSKLTSSARIIIVDEWVSRETFLTMRQLVKFTRQQCKLMGLPKDETSRIMNAVCKAAQYYWAARVGGVSVAAAFGDCFIRISL